MEFTGKRGRLVIALTLGLLMLGCASPATKPSAGGPDAKAAYQQHVSLAKQYIGLKNRELARIHLSKAERFQNAVDKTRLSELYNGYALLYQSELEMELAEKYYRKALVSDATDSVARYNFSSFLFNQERFEEALEQIVIVSKDLDYRRRPQAFYITGLVQIRLGDTVGALKSFERATQLAAQFALPYLEIAKIYFDQKNDELAKQSVLYYMGLAGETAEGLWLLVQTELRMGNSQATLENGTKLKTLFPDSDEVVKYKGLLK